MLTASDEIGRRQHLSAATNRAANLPLGVTVQTAPDEPNRTNIMDHLAQGLKRRHPEALAELYKFYSPRTLSAIYCIVRNRATAEDLLQETFWRVWISADKFDPRKGTLLTWLLAIARNQALDYIRSGDARKSRQSCQLREDSFWAVDLKISVVTRTECSQLCEAVKQLTTNQQALIELAYFQGLSQSEIAARLRRPLGTIKNWMRATLQNLRQQLQYLD